jgi:hypothetical protein
MFSLYSELCCKGSGGNNKLHLGVLDIQVKEVIITLMLTARVCHVAST